MDGESRIELAYAKSWIKGSKRRTGVRDLGRAVSATIVAQIEFAAVGGECQSMHVSMQNPAPRRRLQNRPGISPIQRAHESRAGGSTCVNNICIRGLNCDHVVVPALRIAVIRSGRKLCPVAASISSFEKPQQTATRRVLDPCIQRRRAGWGNRKCNSTSMG